MVSHAQVERQAHFAEALNPGDEFRSQAKARIGLVLDDVANPADQRPAAQVVQRGAGARAAINGGERDDAGDARLLRDTERLHPPHLVLGRLASGLHEDDPPRHAGACLAAQLGRSVGRGDRRHIDQPRARHLAGIPEMAVTVGERR